MNALGGLVILGVLVFLLFTAFIPSAASISLTTGNRSSGSTTNGGTIIFSDVNISLQDVERIPLVSLNFTIFDRNGDAAVENVVFHVTGLELVDANNRFNVTLMSPNITVLASWNTYGLGYDVDYGYRWNQTVAGFGFGYGTAGANNITLSYRIRYTTHFAGSFYGRLFANATLTGVTKMYSSAPSNFTVTSGVSPPEDGIPSEEGQPGVTASASTLRTIELQFGVSLPAAFNVNDTNGDDILDTFTDPNSVLTEVRFVTINGSAVVLLSINNSSIPGFFWDTTSNTIAVVSYESTTLASGQAWVDTTAKEVITIVEVQKTGWFYFEMTDLYPPIQYQTFQLTVETNEGRTIPADRIWRENGKIYVLDDPAVQYNIIYTYDILPPVFQPADGTTFTIARPTISITYFTPVTINSASFGGIDITNQFSTNQANFTFTPSYDLGNGPYLLSINAQDDNGNTVASTATYFVNLPVEEQTAAFPWLYIIIAGIIGVIVAVLVVLRWRLIL